MHYELKQLPIKTALSELEKLRADYPKTQKYPFFIGSERNLKIFERSPKISVSEIKEIISKSFDIDIAKWLANRQKEENENEWFDEVEKLGQWTEISVKAAAPYVLTRDRFGEQTDFVYTGLAEIESPWMLPAIAGFGGWNDCPWADVQCAAMRYWQEKYGAELITMTGDYLECIVGNPPATKEAAMKLAREQYLFCPDIVDQGTETISNLGAALLNAKLWFFWWD